jgi:hypothetical protein
VPAVQVCFEAFYSYAGLSWIETLMREIPRSRLSRINNLLIPCLAARVLRECECGPGSGTALMLLLMMPEHFVVAGIRR